MIPEVSSPISIKELIKLSEGYNVKLIAYEEEAREGESSVLTKSLESMTKDNLSLRYSAQKVA